MALTGTLSDLGIVDLVQFPGAAKKTGELIVAGVDDEGRLYYVEGELQHVVCSDQVGLEAMILLVSWGEGEFEFRQGVTSTEKTIDMPIPKLLSLAIDEREARKAKKEAAVAAHPATSVLLRALEDAAVKLEFVDHAALYSNDGILVCNWDKGEDDPELGQIIDEMQSIFSAHPRKGLSKVYLTDTNGTSIASVVNDSFVLLLRANELASLGMVSIASTKIVQAITTALAPQ